MWTWSPLVRFQPTRPLRGATAAQQEPLPNGFDFNPRAPCGARLSIDSLRIIPTLFQPTRPLRGATSITTVVAGLGFISTHAPLAGRDFKLSILRPRGVNFNPRAPCGARLKLSILRPRGVNFNPRAPCGARHARDSENHENEKFQPTRPLRGATSSTQLIQLPYEISTHAPLAGRDHKA